MKMSFEYLILDEVFLCSRDIIDGCEVKLKNLKRKAVTPLSDTEFTPKRGDSLQIIRFSALFINITKIPILL